MASIDKVYRTVKSLANKEQKGFITPAVFNRFAALAQQNIYNELFTELVDAKKVSRQNLDPGRDKSVRKRTLEDLSPFIKRITNYGFDPSERDGNVFFKPVDFSRLISLSRGHNGPGSISDRINIEIIYDAEKLQRVLGSNLSTPSGNYPVALVSDAIEVFPNFVTTIDILYYRRPGGISEAGNGDYVDADPQYSSISFDGGLEIFDAASSIDFMLPNHYESELVYEICKMIGISLNDPGMIQVAGQEEIKR
mgnify:CR=1 FL=1|tara:strand:- start:695 stop:1450 length:756 start_codon:yes stop_codon:yes gene_type:complete